MVRVFPGKHGRPSILVAVGIVVRKEGPFVIGDKGLQ
jgi:hypothetical protein